MTTPLLALTSGPIGHMGAPRPIEYRGAAMDPMGPAARSVAGPMQQVARDATAAGPLIPNELIMMDADPSVRVGPILLQNDF